MKLIYKDTGKPVIAGEPVHTHLGKAVIITGWQEPKHENSTGRVYVRTMQDNAFEMSYFPAVIGAVWSE
jgi:hypothetical protein